MSDRPTPDMTKVESRRHFVKLLEQEIGLVPDEHIPLIARIADRFYDHFYDGWYALSPAETLERVDREGCPISRAFATAAQLCGRPTPCDFFGMRINPYAPPARLPIPEPLPSATPPASATATPPAPSTPPTPPAVPTPATPPTPPAHPTPPAVPTPATPPAPPAPLLRVVWQHGDVEVQHHLEPRAPRFEVWQAGQVVVTLAATRAWMTERRTAIALAANLAGVPAPATTVPVAPPQATSSPVTPPPLLRVVWQHGDVEVQHHLDPRAPRFEIWQAGQVVVTLAATRAWMTERRAAVERAADLAGVAPPATATATAATSLAPDKPVPPERIPILIFQVAQILQEENTARSHEAVMECAREIVATAVTQGYRAFLDLETEAQMTINRLCADFEAEGREKIIIYNRF
ncbi:MAG: hypothetical protein EI684_21465 [Candidatus Viridilinea halotolerans]|uniref:Uncharacterized protein n=1 Tax=Candidatus Viridilinea halotolerans TaxID=2491704 RepID=A0A426TRE4_9CHLR|nr:MAG: hypothetical protein EI684_21465 [Candidatus Viridilinea halotolerans]